MKWFKYALLLLLITYPANAGMKMIGGGLGGVVAVGGLATITADVYADGSATDTVTVAIDPTNGLSNRMAFVVVGWEKGGSAGAISSVTYDGNACVNIDTQTFVDGTYNGTALYYCDETDIVDDDSANVVVTPDAAFYVSALVKIYYNVAQQAPVDTDKDTGTDDQCDTSVTTAENGSLVISGISNVTSTNAQAPDQGDELGMESYYQTTDMGSIIDDVAGAQAFNWSLDAAETHGCISAAFSPAAL